MPAHRPAAILMALLTHACAADVAEDCQDPDPEWAYQDAQARWIGYVGPIPQDCLLYPVVTEQVVEVREECAADPGKRTLACNWWSAGEQTYHVEALACLDPGVIHEALVHERAHMLLHCITGDPDGDHENQAVWGKVTTI